MAVSGSVGDSVTVPGRDATTETAGNMDIEADTEYDVVESSPDSVPFRAGDKVLALHCNFTYPARVEKVEYRDGEWRFYVHYLGWKKRYDEWVGIDRVSEFSEQSLQEQRLLDNKDGLEKITKPGVATEMKPESTSGTSGKKRKKDHKSQTSESEKLVNVQIPMSLRKHLVNQRDSITKEGKLIKLPRSPNVDEILKKYAEYWLKKDARVADSVAGISNGLQLYFDKALPAMLLYKSEREQYQEVTANKIPPSTVYGAEHLLRLFVKLPEILFYANIEKETLAELQQKLQDFLRFLQKNETVFFLPV